MTFGSPDPVLTFVWHAGTVYTQTGEAVAVMTLAEARERIPASGAAPARVVEGLPRQVTR